MVLWPDDGAAMQPGSAQLQGLRCPVLSFEEALLRGQAALAAGTYQPRDAPARDELATLIYTSGTTGACSAFGHTLLQPAAGEG